jgi:hypothetical protein
MRTLGRAVCAGCAGLVAALLFAACSKCGGDAAKDAAAKPAPSGTPKIVAVEESFDFGKVKQGDEATHVFKIRNAGDGELKIEKARGS